MSGNDGMRNFKKEKFEKCHSGRKNIIYENQAFIEFFEYIRFKI
jgi:hypothetical protein